MKIAMTVGLLAIMLFSLGLPAFATTGQPGPTPPQLGDPVAATNEVQMVRLLGVATGGAFRLAFGDTTVNLPYNFQGSAIESALEKIGEAPSNTSGWNIVDVSVNVVGSPGPGLRGRSFAVTFNEVRNPSNVQVYDVVQMGVAGPDPAGTAPNTPLTGSRAVYGVLNAAVLSGVSSIVVDEIARPADQSMLPPVVPFGIKIGGETYTVNSRTSAGAPGRYTYGLSSPTTAGYAVGAMVSSDNPNPFVVVETAQNGVGVPEETQVSPHGGYSSVTDYCLQCHAVHAYDIGNGVVQPGPFALQQAGSVTDTCNTCHSLFDNGASAGTGTPVNSDAITGKPSIPGGMATASLRSVYDLGNGQYLAGGSGAIAGHEIGASTSPDGTVIEGEIGGASDTQGGLYCGSCHTPHGDFGKLVNSVWYRSEALGASNEIQLLTISDTASTTKFRLTFGGQTTPTSGIAANATAATIESALQGLSSIGVGGVNVSPVEPPPASPQAAFEIQFTGLSPLLQGLDQPLIASNNAIAVISPVEDGGNTTEFNVGNTLMPWVENGIFYEGRTNKFYLHFDTTNGRNVWQKCTAINGGGTCSDLTTVDMEGQQVYLYGYKLLSRFPNGSGEPESWGMGQGGHDGARWCGTCHPAQMSAEVGGDYHSHPGSCTYCHGNPADGSSFDFPHTSTNGSLLKEYPDALCIVCHSKGSLP